MKPLPPGWSRFCELRRRYPQVRVYAYTLIMRCNRAITTRKSRITGRRGGIASFASGISPIRRSRPGLTPEEDAELSGLRGEVPEALLRGYQERRRVNHRANLLCLKALRDGLFDFLVIPQDDAAEYGYMCVEQREIRRRIAEYRIGTRCYLYPGADEAGCTMLARAVNEDRGSSRGCISASTAAAAEQVRPCMRIAT